jgi:hypothetical protein
MEAMTKTRSIPLPDGGEEIVRILDDQLLNTWRRDNPLAFEKSIVWLQPLDTLDFVRVATIRTAKSRRGPLRCSAGIRILGYSKLTPDAPFNPQTKAYTRRVFYLTDSDSELNLNQFPKGALDPQTILPGVAGTAPSREQSERGYPWWLRRDGRQSDAQPSAAETR